MPGCRATLLAVIAVAVALPTLYVPSEAAAQSSYRPDGSASAFGGAYNWHYSDCGNMLAALARDQSKMPEVITWMYGFIIAGQLYNQISGNINMSEFIEVFLAKCKAQPNERLGFIAREAANSFSG